MKSISVCRQINIEDITELTPRKNAVTVHIKLNKPPQLEEVDNKISQPIDVLTILEQSLDSIEQDYFLDEKLEGESDDSEEQNDEEVDQNWAALHQEYNEEIQGKDTEYEALLQKLTNSNL